MNERKKELDADMSWSQVSTFDVRRLQTAVIINNKNNVCEIDKPLTKRGPVRDIGGFMNYSKFRRHCFGIIYAYDSFMSSIKD